MHPRPEAARQLTLHPDPDGQRLARIRSGDAMAFESLFRSYAASLFAFATSYVGSRAVAEELVQDVFCRLWDHRAETAAPTTVRAYLFGALRNRALNHLQGERTLLDFTAGGGRHSPAVTTRDGADGELAAPDLPTALDLAVHAMPARCREVFVLVRSARLSYAEVADVLGVSTGTVEIRMSRALARVGTLRTIADGPSANRLPNLDGLWSRVRTRTMPLDRRIRPSARPTTRTRNRGLSVSLRFLGAVAAIVVVAVTVALTIARRRETPGPPPPTSPTHPVVSVPLQRP